ncbi:MAG: tetratricopeptide repeat protein, partial [Candidatus Muiribacteriota bacterium]
MLLSCPFLSSKGYSGEHEFCIKEKCQFFDYKNRACVIATIGEASVKYLNYTRMFNQEKELEKEKEMAEALDKVEKKDKYNIFLSKGFTLYKNRNFQQAELELKKALVYNDGGFEAHKFLGEIYRENHRFDEAVMSFREALKIKKDYELVQKLVDEYYKLYHEFPDKDVFYKDLIDKFKKETEGDNSDFGYFALACAYYRFPLKDISEKARLDLSFSNLSKNLQSQKNIVRASFLLYELNQTSEFVKGKEVIDYILKAKDSEPDNAYVYLYLAKAYFKYGSHYDAEKIMTNIKKAVEIGGDDSFIIYNYGLILEKYHFLSKAAVEYNKALELDPENIVIMEALAHVYSISNLYEKTIDTYKKLAEINPDNNFYFEKLAELYYLKSDYKCSADFYKKLIDKKTENGDYFRLYYQSLNQLLSAEEKNKHIENLHRETELETFNYVKHVHYAYSLIYMNENHLEEPDFSNLKDILSRIIRLEPDFYHAYWELAKLYINKGETKDEALNLVQKLLDKPLNDAVIYFNAAVIYNMLENTELAVENLQKAIEVQPDYRLAYKELLNIYDRINNTEELKNTASDFIRIYPNESDAYYYLGRIAVKKNSVEDAIDSLKKACEIDPRFEKAHYLLAQIYEENGMFDFARLYFEKSVTLNNNNKDAYYRLGKIYKRDKNFNEAQIAFKKAIELDKDFVQAYIELARLHVDEENPAKAVGMYEKALL